ncbi:MAG: hypothetical protein AAB395_03250 [Patescibacteria group bacterium]
MTISTIILAISVALAVFGYFSKKRLGLPSLGLAAGALISQQWSSYVTLFLQDQGIQLIAPPLSNVVIVVLIVLPAILLMSVSGKEHGKIPRLFESFVFGLLAASLLVTALGTNSDKILISIEQYVKIITVVALITALTNILLTHRPRKKPH